MKTQILAMLLLLFIGACNGKGGAFSGLEESADDTDSLEVAVEIESVTPTSNPVIMTTNSLTYAVAVNSGAGNVTYDFLLDGTTTVQSSTSPFYSLLGSSLSAGNHTLKVTATNSVSSDDHTFNVRRNSAPAALSSSPVFTGNTVNCDDGTLVFNALTADSDGDAYTQTWMLDGAAVNGSTPGTVVTNVGSSAQLSFAPSCSVAGFHTITLRLTDGYETTDLVWNVSVANPAVETIIGYYPTSNIVTYLSTTVNSLFNATGSGVGALTFTWTLDGVTISTTTSGTTSNLTLLASAMTVGTHTLTVTLTDSSATNDPVIPATRSWTIYKNQKPNILSPSPSAAKAINFASSLGITASIEDNSDTFITTITKGGLDCVPASECGLSSVTLPTSTGAFSSLFTADATFLGENTYTLRVVDTYGEEDTETFTVSVNYFSNTCNDLDAGEVCTISGPVGLGSGLNAATEGNKIRVRPWRLFRESNGSYFISDNTTNTVYYWNRSGGTVSRLGISNITNNQVVLVAGTGVGAAGGSGSIATKMSLNFGYWGGGVAYDSTRGELFIADYSNNRVIRVDNTGRGYIICGNSNQQTQGGLSVNALCRNPVEVAWDESNRRLYVANNSDHAIKLIDASNATASNWVVYNILGVNGSLGTAGTEDGTTNLTGFYTTAVGTARAWQPWGLFLDTTDQILYFTEYGSNRVRALGLPGATTRTVGGQTISDGNVTSITGVGLASTSVNAYNPYTIDVSTNLSDPILDDSGVPTGNFRGCGRPNDVVVDKTGGVVRGLFVSCHDHNRVTYINNSGGSLVIGNMTVGNNQMINVFGNGGTGSINPVTGRNTAVVNPAGLELEGSTLVVAAAWDAKMKTLSFASSNGAVQPNYFGEIGRCSYSGNAAMDSSLVTFCNPQDMMYKESGGTVSDPILGDSLYISDISTNYIRRLDVITGRVEDFIGTGANAGTVTQNTVPTSTAIADTRGMAMYNEFFLYTDVNNNCMVRAFNPNSVSESFFGTTVNQGRVSTVMGNANNCGAFVGTTPLLLSDASNARLNNPWGIGADPTRGVVYIASYSGHCIVKVTDLGIMSTMEPFIGTCGSAGGPIYGGPLATPMLLRFPKAIIMDKRPGLEGNFFFTDWTDQGTAHVKYINLVSATPVEFYGGAISVAQNNIETIYGQTASPGRIEGIALFEEWMCFASTLSNTVTCRDRDLGTTQTFGVAGSGGVALSSEQEGISATSPSSTLTFAYPQAVEFDKDGNLYIVERVGQQVRKIKRWF